jgi:predicted AlkP superfamily pyrophosphatase or phosphodiesterase
MSYDTIEDAFNYISTGQPGDRRAMVNRVTGKVFLESAESVFDKIPPEFDSDSDYLLIPSRQDLDPGKSLILEFFNTHAQAEVPQVKAIFNRSGGFRNVKALMRSLHLLDLWHIYAEKRIEELLRKWCQDNGLGL